MWCLGVIRPSHVAGHNKNKNRSKTLERYVLSRRIAPNRDILCYKLVGWRSNGARFCASVVLLFVVYSYPRWCLVCFRRPSGEIMLDGSRNLRWLLFEVWLGHIQPRSGLGSSAAPVLPRTSSHRYQTVSPLARGENGCLLCDGVLRLPRSLCSSFLLLCTPLTIVVTPPRICIKASYLPAFRGCLLYYVRSSKL